LHNRGGDVVKSLARGIEPTGTEMERQSNTLREIMGKKELRICKACQMNIAA